jgi:hypothetical protein
VPYTGGTENYRDLIDRTLMAGGTSSDIQALMAGTQKLKLFTTQCVALIRRQQAFLMAKSLMGGRRLLAVRRAILPLS